MNIGLVYSALIEDNEQALKELNDIFEENELERVEGKYELYYVVFDYNVEILSVDDYNIMVKRFNTVRECQIFIETMIEMSNIFYVRGSHINIFYQERKEDLKKVLQDVIDSLSGGY